MNSGASKVEDPAAVAAATEAEAAMKSRDSLSLIGKFLLL
jgi:hypothetical protein